MSWITGSDQASIQFWHFCHIEDLTGDSSFPAKIWYLFQLFLKHGPGTCKKKKILTCLRNPPRTAPVH